MGYDTYDTRLKRTMQLLLLIVAIVVTFRAGQYTATPAHHPHPGCRAEDMIRVFVQHEQADWPAGTAACVHIDNLEDSR